jgi:hypothetical protein
MRLVPKILLCFMPLAVTLGGWQLAIAVNDALGCDSIGKSPRPCLAGNLDLQPMLAFVGWWGMLLWMPGLLISGLLLGQVLARRLPRPLGQAPRER